MSTNKKPQAGKKEAPKTVEAETLSLQEGTEAAPVAFMGEQITGITFGSCGIIFSEDTKQEDWMQAGVVAGGAHKVSQFFLGDWLNFGIKKFPNFYKEAIVKTGMTYGTLKNMASTCKAFPIEKRNEALSFGHHQVLKAIKEPAKLASTIKKVIDDNLSVAGTSLLLKAEPRPKTPEEREKELIKVDEEHRASALTLITYFQSVPRFCIEKWRSLAPDMLTTLTDFTADVAKHVADFDAKKKEEDAKKEKNETIGEMNAPKSEKK